MHDPTLLITLAGGLAAAFALGWAAQKIGPSTRVGRMLAGIIVGPYAPGFVANGRLASQMAEIGVGVHFRPQELLRVWRLAVPGAVGRSLVAGACGWALARGFGWSHAAGAVLGMSLAVAGTVVPMRMPVEQNRPSTRDGRVAVGRPIVEDLYKYTVAALRHVRGDSMRPEAPAAANDAERARLAEFGAHRVCGALDEQTARAVRAVL